jgi:hypothetical protein
MTCEQLKIIQSELKALLDNNNSTNEDFKKFYNRHGFKYSSKLETDIKDYCSNISGYLSVNIAEIPDICVQYVKDLCIKLHPKGPGTWAYEECRRKYAPFLKDIYQTNTSITNNECIINTIIGDPELAANYKLGVAFNMLLADKIINCDTRDINKYTEIFDSEQKIKMINECFNSSLVEQRNYVSGCRVANKTQVNLSEIINKCLITTNLTPTQIPTQLPTTEKIFTKEPVKEPVKEPSVTQLPINTNKETNNTSKIINNRPTPSTNTLNYNLIFIIAGVILILFIITIFLLLKKFI